MTSNMLRQTTIIIPVKDDPKVEACLDSINEDVEVVLSLNGATDLVREIGRQHPLQPIMTEIPEANIAAAYNAGIESASGRYLLFMDSDCTFRPDTIRKLVQPLTNRRVVKGRVEFTPGTGLLSRIIASSRTFEISDHVSAYSPPLIYDRTIVEKIGGYHYQPLLYWGEDRELDFRLQLADISVEYVPDAIVVHAAQTRAADLRSAFRYGIADTIGQELGLFITPSILWNFWSDLRSVLLCARRKSLLTALYRVVWLGSLTIGTLFGWMYDPYRVRARYPTGAKRYKMWRGVPEWGTKLSDRHKRLLRRSHMEQGRNIGKKD